MRPASPFTPTSMRCCAPVASTACWWRRRATGISRIVRAAGGRRAADPVREAVRRDRGAGARSRGDRRPPTRSSCRSPIGAASCRRCSDCASASPVASWAQLYFVACYQWDGAPPPAAFRAGSGGIFVDMGVHEFDQIRWLTGQEIVAAARRCRDRRHDLAARRRCGKRAGAVHAVRRQHGDWCRSAGAFRSAMSAASRCSARADAEDCRFLWPPDGDASFHEALRRQAEAFARRVGGARPMAPRRPTRSRPCARRSRRRPR